MCSGGLEGKRLRCEDNIKIDVEVKGSGFIEHLN
jgi:hypothetical protein